METIGGIILEFFLYVFGTLRYAIHYPKPFAIGLIICGAYLTAAYVELSLVAAIELISNIGWPLMHIGLRGVERFFKSLGNLTNSFDDLGTALYCDMSILWCERFGLMCNNQCSFTSLALERFRSWCLLTSYDRTNKHFSIPIWFIMLLWIYYWISVIFWIEMITVEIFSKLILLYSNKKPHSTTLQ